MSKGNPKNILVANAWPYANGPLHIGHVAALLGGDILVRYHRLCGDRAIMVSGSDCYGTPIVVEAEAQGVSPADFSERYHKEFEKVFFDDLHFSYDLYTKTSTPEHAKVVQDIFLKLYNNGFIYTKREDALFSSELNRFLPDRFVEGVCPHCGYESARGDQCDECGKLIDALTLGNPRLNKKIVQHVDGDVTLEVRQTEHFYIKLQAFQQELEEWISSVGDEWRLHAKNFSKGFLSQGLEDRAITRDTTWGIDIPLDGYEDKKIYVWFEAVLGYFSTTKQYAHLQGDEHAWKQWWLSDARHYYTQGKDNVVFHSIILPSILLGTKEGYHLPDRIFASEYITLEGKQLSTSRNYAVWVNELAGEIDLELLRFFLSAHGPENGDIDFRWEEFARVVNGELIGTFGNLVNRIASFAEKNFPEGIDVEVEDARRQKAEKTASRVFEVVGELIEKGKFSRAFREIMVYAEEGNKFAHTTEPWKTIAVDRVKATQDVAELLYMIKNLAILIQPFLPQSSIKIQSFFGERPITSNAGDLCIDTPSWGSVGIPHRMQITAVSPLFIKVEEDFVQHQVEKLRKLG